MSDTRARTGVEVQLGARARSILKTLSNAAPDRSSSLAVYDSASSSTEWLAPLG